jgi:RNA polymerase-binding transcription factor DksA
VVRDTQQLEGLLKARSNDLRTTRRRRRVADRTADPPAAQPDAPAGRVCSACGGEIGARRARALPRATRCLACQRAAERAATPT